MASYCPLNYTYIKIALVSANGKVMHVSTETSSYIMDVSTCSYMLNNYVHTLKTQLLQLTLIIYKLKTSYCTECILI